MSWPGLVQATLLLRFPGCAPFVMSRGHCLAAGTIFRLSQGFCLPFWWFSWVLGVRFANVSFGLGRRMVTYLLFWAAVDLCNSLHLSHNNKKEAFRMSVIALHLAALVTPGYIKPSFSHFSILLGSNWEIPCQLKHWSYLFVMKVFLWFCSSCKNTGLDSPSLKQPNYYVVQVV